MARTVDTTSTFENWRQNYNDLATDVGGLGTSKILNMTEVMEQHQIQYSLVQIIKLIL